MDTYAIIRDAIETKKQIHCDYDGYHREMCPHVLGKKFGDGKTKGTHTNCLFYQFAGQSSRGVIVPGSPANWRCVDISKLQNVTAVVGAWYTGDNHSTAQTCVDDVECSIKF